MWYPTTSSDELYHHGILGQKWGHRGGPPYPLDREDHTAAEKKAMRKAARAERKAAHKEKKEHKKELKIQKKEAKKEAERQKILKTGDAKQVSKLKGNISNQEYTEVFKRLENEKKMDELTSEKAISMATKFNAAKNSLNSIDSASKSALNIYNRGASIYNVLARNHKDWTVQKMPIIKDGGEKNENKNENKDENNKK